ncbi:MAG: Glu-tRNA(Gln) amidotransferase subunit GatE [Candidatus Bilamarchaeaceae archaeon]
MKIGLEIHQRLLSKKLFCSCSSELAEEMPHEFIVKRQLRPVLSEMGEMDEASRQEFENRKQFEYLVYPKNNCLVELDEEPPHEMNKEALAIALEIALHLNAKPVDEIHVMRKIVIDGSNTCGFQRTAIIALDGWLETGKGKVNIPTIAIEEESAGIVKAEDGKITYRLDRLGIPLIEISTAPEIKDGEHLLEVAERIGMIMRATGKVARGLGTIRQDVNVSIEGGARVEIKGAQELKMLPQLVENEIKRQQKLIEIIEQLKKSGKITIKKEFTDVTHIFTATEAKIIKNGLAAGQKVFALALPNHAGLLGIEIGPNRRYGTELSEYAKTAGVKGIIHSDESMEKYGIKPAEIQELRTTLNLQPQDAFVLVVAESSVAKKALQKVHERAIMDFVPKETRRANPDGTTSYMRPLPGRARLYPETDVPPIKITKELLKEIEKQKGASLEEKRKTLYSMLNKEMAEQMLKSKNLNLFERLVGSFPSVEPTLIATTLENTVVSLRREGVQIDDIEKVMFELLEEYQKGSFVKAAILDILKARKKYSTIAETIKKENLWKISGKELQKIAEENNYDLKAIMAKYRLRIDANELKEIISKKGDS